MALRLIAYALCADTQGFFLMALRLIAYALFADTPKFCLALRTAR
jgi:hypothetical protein